MHSSRTSFLFLSSSFASQLSTICAHVHAHVTAYMPACILCMYTYIHAWHERREDSIPLWRVIQEKRWKWQSDRDRRRKKYRNGRKRLRERHDTIRGLRKKSYERERKGDFAGERDIGTLITSLSCSSQWAFGQSNRDEDLLYSNEKKGCEDQSVREVVAG